MRKGFERWRVLVTGGAGFLGSHLCERLIAEHWDVLCVDNFFTGSRENVAGLLSDPHFELMWSRKAMAAALPERATGVPPA